MNTKEEILAKISQIDNVWIFPHIDLDADALGSAYGLKCLLEDMGKTAEVITEFEFQKRFGVQEGQAIAEETSASMMGVIKLGKETRMERPDFIVAVDSANLSRLGYRSTIFQEFTDQGNTISIDHHKGNPGYANLNYVDSISSSCGEALCDIFLSMDKEVKPDVANNIYMTIMSDSKNLTTDNSSRKTTEWYNHLEKFFTYDDKFKMIDVLFGQKSLEAQRLDAYARLNMKPLIKGIMFVCINRDVFNEYNAMFDDARDIVGGMLKTKGVKVAILVKEGVPLKSADGVQRLFKVSMRSKTKRGGLNVREVCANFPGGGGHDAAAGFTIMGKDIDEKYIEKELERVLKIELHKQRGVVL